MTLDVNNAATSLSFNLGYPQSLNNYKRSFVSKICLNKKCKDRALGEFSVVFLIHIWVALHSLWIKGQCPSVWDNDHGCRNRKFRILFKTLCNLNKCILVRISLGLPLGFSRKTGDISEKWWYTQGALVNGASDFLINWYCQTVLILVWKQKRKDRD